MNKNEFLKELEQQLLAEKVNNPYSILRDISTNIDQMIMKGKTMEDALKSVGSIDDIIIEAQPKVFSNDDQVYEDKKPLEEENSSSNHSNYNSDQFSESMFSNKKRQFTNRHTNSNLLNIILYLLIGLIILSFIGRIFFFGIFAPTFGMGYFHFFSRNFFSFVVAVLIAVVVIKVLKNK